jgi:hypothetical protein
MLEAPLPEEVFAAAAAEFERGLKTSAAGSRGATSVSPTIRPADGDQTVLDPWDVSGPWIGAS